MQQFTRKTGANKGAPRTWLEGLILEAHGWVTGTEFVASIHRGFVTYTRNGANVADLPFPPPILQKTRRVAGKPGRPVIDTIGEHLRKIAGFTPGNLLTVLMHGDYIAVFDPKVVESLYTLWPNLAADIWERGAA